MKDFVNFIAEAKDPNEYDNEGEMAKSQLRTVMSAAEDLMNLLDDEDNLPEWAQGKITKAVDYLDSVRDYMTSEAQDDLEESVELQEDAALEKFIKQTGIDIAKNDRGQVTTLGDRLDYEMLATEVVVTLSLDRKYKNIHSDVVRDIFYKLIEKGAFKSFERARPRRRGGPKKVFKPYKLHLGQASVNLDEQFEEAFDYFLTDEDIDEAIVESIKIPTDIAKRIPGVKGMLYKKALRYYLDWRKKNPGQGQQGLVKVAKILRVDPKELNILLWNLVNKGKLPRHLAVTDPDTPIGRFKFDNSRGGFLQK